MTLEELNAAAAELRQSINVTPYAKATKDEDRVRLEAILALARSVIPSGQVAEDAKLCRTSFDVANMREDGAVGAHCYAAVSARCARAARLERAEENANRLIERCFEAERQLDGLQTKWHELVRDNNTRVAERDTALARVKTTEDALLVSEFAAFLLKKERNVYRMVARMDPPNDADTQEAERVGAQERAHILMDAKNHWADRARAAEATLAAIRARATNEQGRESAYGGLQHPSNVALAVAQWILEGDTNETNPPTTSESSRYPCSPTCTHDDAATPGHPERVKERSEVFVKRAENHHKSVTEGYEAGAEDMRAACMEAVLGVLTRFGFQRVADPLSVAMREAVEGAAP